MSRIIAGFCLTLIPSVVFVHVSLTAALTQSYAANIATASSIYFTVSCAIFATSLLRSSDAGVWSPVTWFVVATGVFYGFGPLVETLGTDATRLRLSVHPLSITGIELLKAVSLSQTGALLICLGVLVHGRLAKESLIRYRAGATVRIQDGFNSLSDELIVSIILLGAVYKYIILLPSAWGLIDVTIPGALSPLGNLIDIGFALAAMRIGLRSKRSSGLLLAFFLIGVPINLVITATNFSKFDLIFSMMLPMVGYIYSSRRFLIAAVFSIVLLFVYTASSEMVYVGRKSVEEITSVGGVASYSDRLEILQNYVTGPNENNIQYQRDPQYDQGWWTRLNFSGVQAFAMSQYDNGRAGQTMTDAWMRFVPRAIWHDKPIMTPSGREFYSLVTGNPPTSSLAISIYGDLYWNYGWFGVIIFCPLIGFLYGMLSARSVAYIRNFDLIMIPVTLMSIRLATLGTNNFVVDRIIGQIPIIFGYIFFVYVVRQLLSRPPRSAMLQRLRQNNQSR